MGVGIRARDADLEARGLGARRGRRDEPDARGAVLQPPRDGDGCPEVLDQPLVRVDGRRDDGHDVRQAVEQAGEEVAAQVGEVDEVRPGGVLVFGAAVKEVLVGGVDDGDVHMAAVSGEALARLGHEAGRYAVLAAEGFDDVSENALSA